MVNPGQGNWVASRRLFTTTALGAREESVVSGTELLPLGLGHLRSQQKTADNSHAALLPSRGPRASHCGRSSVVASLNLNPSIPTHFLVLLQIICIVA